MIPSQSPEQKPSRTPIPWHPGFGECYLARSRSGVPWLLDDSSARLRKIFHDAEARHPGTPVHAPSVLADIPLLRRLLNERHFGLATGRVAPGDTTEALERWHREQRRTLPRTWGELAGPLQEQLGRALGDNHLRIVGAPPPKAGNRQHVATEGDSGAAVETSTLGDVLVVRIRRLIGSADDDRALADWAAAHQAHFQHRAILVDLRGNSGGNDGYSWAWAQTHFNRVVRGWCRSQEWLVGGRGLGNWNATAWWSMRVGREQVPTPLQRQRHAPCPDDRVRVSELEAVDLEFGPQPWDGRMVVYVDGATASSGESTAWLLKRGLGAVVVGAPTHGQIEYGNIARYVLPSSSLVLSLPTRHNDFGVPVEHTGFPVDHRLDVDTPVHEVVDRFLGKR